MINKSGVIFAVIGFIIFLFCEAWGEDWKLYRKDRTESLHYYDAETITYSSKNTVRVWYKMVYTEKGVIQAVADLGPKYKDLGYHLAFSEFNCADRKSQLLDAILYSRDGSVLDIYKYKTPYWLDVMPESVEEALYEIVCKKDGIKK